MEPHATPTRPSADHAAARILAASALVVAAIVVIVVIAGSTGGSGGGVRSAGGHHVHKPKDKYYVVQPGDTFGGIAAKEKVSVRKLEQLNPNLDTQLLPERGCVNLVPEGCKVLEKNG